MGGHVTVGDALAGGANVVTVGGEGMCGRYAASVGVHGGVYGSCNEGAAGSSRFSSSNSSGVFVTFADDDAAIAVVKSALAGGVRRQQLLQGQYLRLYENQQLRYWAQLEAGIKMAIDQQQHLQETQRQLHVTVVASEPDTFCLKS